MFTNFFYNMTTFCFLLATLVPHTGICMTINSLKITLEEKDPNYLSSYLENKITTEANNKTGLKKVCEFAIKAHDEEGNIVGGLSGYEFYGSIVIDVLWVEPAYRKLKIGSSLMEKLEEIAKERKVKFITVSTMEWWECVDFYENHGFELEFVRDGFEMGYKQYHLKKHLIS